MRRGVVAGYLRRDHLYNRSYVVFFQFRVCAAHNQNLDAGIGYRSAYGFYSHRVGLATALCTAVCRVGSAAHIELKLLWVRFTGVPDYVFLAAYGFLLGYANAPPCINCFIMPAQQNCTVAPLSSKLRQQLRRDPYRRVVISKGGQMPKASAGSRTPTCIYAPPFFRAKRGNL